MSYAFYLAGRIQKTHEASDQKFWGKQEISSLRKAFPDQEIMLLNPAERLDDLADQLSVFGRDMTQVFVSDAVIVDARERCGLGVGAEMMWAKLHQKPVIIWAPQGSHYIKEKAKILDQQEVNRWVHPFVECLGDLIIDDFSEILPWLQTLDKSSIKGVPSIHQAMKYYQQTQFEDDLPMKDLFDKNAQLSQRLEN